MMAGLVKRHLIVMIFIIIIACIGIPLSAQILEQLPDNLLKGRIIFEKKHCDHCHTIGDGGIRDLSKEDVGNSFGELAAKIWNHAPKMDIEYTKLGIEWPEFTEQELIELTAFLYFITYLGNVGDVDNGKQLIAAKKCLICHQIGRRGNKRGPALDKLKRFVSPLHVMVAIWNHAPEMIRIIKEREMSLPEIRGKDMEDITAYIREVSRGSIGEEVYLSPGNPHTGKELFKKKRCIMCHSVEGKGGKKGPSIESMDLKKSVTEIACMMWNHADIMLKVIEAKGMRWPVLSGQQMADLIAYLYFVGFPEKQGKPDIGKNIVEAKKCLICHSIGDIGGRGGTNLAKAEYDSEADMIAALLNHVPQMKDLVIEKGVEWPTFTAEDLRHIFAYLESIQK
jgi:cytochrome c2